MALVREMPVKITGAHLNEHDTRIWRIIDHYVEAARARADFSSTTKIGTDETSSKNGHNYISNSRLESANHVTIWSTDGFSVH